MAGNSRFIPVTSSDCPLIPVMADASTQKDHKDQGELAAPCMEERRSFLANKDVSTAVQSSGSPDRGCESLFFASVWPGFCITSPTLPR